MAENKTRASKASVAAFLNAIDDKHKTGKSCLYLKTLDDVDESVLEKLIHQSVKLMRKRYNIN